MMLAAICLILSTLASPPDEEFKKCFPLSGELPGVVMVDTVRTYNGEALFDFIDGAADIYFEYGFRRAAAARYTTGPDSTLDAEVHEMNSTESAYGIFSMYATDAPRPFQAGDSAVAGDYFVFVWQGRFFVSVTSNRPLAQNDAKVRMFVRSLVRRLSGDGHKPKLVESVSSKYRATSVVYLRGALGFRNRTSFALHKVPSFIDGVSGTANGASFVVLRFANGDSCRAGVGSFVGQLKAKKYSASSSKGKGMTLSNSEGRLVTLQALSQYMVVAEGTDSKAVGPAFEMLREIVTNMSQKP